MDTSKLLCPYRRKVNNTVCDRLTPFNNLRNLQNHLGLSHKKGANFDEFGELQYYKITNTRYNRIVEVRRQLNERRRVSHSLAVVAWAIATAQPQPQPQPQYHNQYHKHYLNHKQRPAHVMTLTGIR